jgi:nucleoside 2-deoxyribosyltransferase
MHIPKKRKAVDDAKVIDLIGSTKFKDEYLAAEKDFTEQGNIVIRTPYFSHAENEELTAELSETLYELGKKRIDMCDVVVVVNAAGYIGFSTHMEILYAMATGKAVLNLFNEMSGTSLEHPKTWFPNMSLVWHGKNRFTIYASRQQGSTALLIILAAMQQRYIFVRDKATAQYAIEFATMIFERIPGVVVVDGKPEPSRYWPTYELYRQDDDQPRKITSIDYFKDDEVFVDDINWFNNLDIVRSYTKEIVGEVIKI